MQLLDDLYSFDPVTMVWTLFAAFEDSARPSARFLHGFTSTADKLYVHGGAVYPVLPTPAQPGELLLLSVSGAMDPA